MSEDVTSALTASGGQLALDLELALRNAPPDVVGRVLAALGAGWTGAPGRLSIIVDHGPRGASVRKVFEEAQRGR